MGSGSGLFSRTLKLCSSSRWVLLANANQALIYLCHRCGFWGSPERFGLCSSCFAEQSSDSFNPLKTSARKKRRTATAKAPVYNESNNSSYSGLDFDDDDDDDGEYVGQATRSGKAGDSEDGSNAETEGASASAARGKGKAKAKRGGTGHAKATVKAKAKGEGKSKGKRKAQAGTSDSDDVDDDYNFHVEHEEPGELEDDDYASVVSDSVRRLVSPGSATLEEELEGEDELEVEEQEAALMARGSKIQVRLNARFIHTVLRAVSRTVRVLACYFYTQSYVLYLAL
jgi:hypothetical protein